MDQVFQALIDRSRAPLDPDRVKTIFGDKKRPHSDIRKKNPTRWGFVVETDDYNTTIFKVRYGKMTLKIYSKDEHVLRIEIIGHNTMTYRWGRSLAGFPEIVGRLKGIPERFLDAVGCIDACFVSDETQIHSGTGAPESEYGVRRAPYGIKKLRAKGMVRKIGKSRR
jgi:hypothetical protein